MSQVTIPCPICGTEGEQYTFCETCRWFLTGDSPAVTLSPIPDRKLTELNRAMAAYRAGWQREQSDSRELEGQLAMARAANASLERALTEARTQNQKLDNSLLLSRKTVQILQAQLDQANGQIGRLQAENAQLQTVPDRRRLVLRKKEPVPVKLAPPDVFQPLTDARTAPANDPNTFQIDHGTLIRYTGPDRIVQVPEGVRTIQRGAFRGNSRLKLVVLPETVTTIQARAFAFCAGLELIHLPDGLQELGSHAFFNCPKLAAVRIPAGIGTIPTSCFRECANLQTVFLPDKVKKIENLAFSGCISLKTITLPRAAKVYESAFEGCTQLNIQRVCV